MPDDDLTRIRFELNRTRMLTRALFYSLMFGRMASEPPELAQAFLVAVFEKANLYLDGAEAVGNAEEKAAAPKAREELDQLYAMLATVQLRKEPPIYRA